MKNNFDFIAKYYDLLANLVYGSAIRKSQVDNLKHIKAKDHVLVLGGGTGWILEEIADLDIPLDITYVDSSKEMIKRSKKRDITNSLSVNFICGDVNEISLGKHDVIITNFFLDVFKEDFLLSVMSHLKGKLKDEGIWLFTDFNKTDNYYHQFLLIIMFWFFRLTANLESKSLPGFNHYFHAIGLKKLYIKTYYNGMIQSMAFS